MRKLLWFSFGLCLMICLFFSCSSPKRNPGLHFTRLPSSYTNISFQNTINENDSVNMFVNEYTYMGSGVGIDDFNNDGLQDIFFCASQQSSKLYINKGDLRFEDITEKSGVSTKAWCTGVSVVDINNDGWPDIYVCVSGSVPAERRKNLLFINQHNLTFKEEAAAYGLDDTSYSTQAAFFDYDGDGRLDMYLLNHTLTDRQPNTIRDRKIDSNAIAQDKLYHNEGSASGTNHPLFKDASRMAGILEDGNGLGIAVSDVNNDGLPDIYIANDYIVNDVLWLNNGNGTFSNGIASAIRHQSYSSMGTDAADLNNDTLTDLVTLDMQPEGNERKKMMYSFLTDQRHQMEMEKGYEAQYIHNMLQLNNGTRTVNGRQEPYFSEIGEMAGIAETDWSWSVLLADLDNDGWKDIHITNGLGRDPTNIDFLEYRHNTVMQSGIPDSDRTQRKVFMDHLTSLGEAKLRNYLYRNKGDLSFEDITESGGIDELSVSNGAAYADLDNDGDLDIITNNINSEAFVMQNDLYYGKKKQSASHYLTIALQGDVMNREGIGAKVFACFKNGVQSLEQYPVRGYLSTVDGRLHIGFANDKPDSIKVVWPDKKVQVIAQPSVDTILMLSYANAAIPSNTAKPLLQPLFSEAAQNDGFDFTHKETFFFDFAFQPLLQQKYSQEGPFMSTGDMNGDGREDVFTGGAYKQWGKVFLQNKDGSFTGKDLSNGTKNEEDMQSALFDADGDGDADLLIVSGSSEFEPGSSFYRPRLYMNDGRGNFTLNEKAFSPLIRTPGKCVAVADMDGDGDTDVFIGGRVSPGTFPKPVRSYLLRNDGGVFTDVTRAVCPALEEAGQMNAVAWTDMNSDNKPDLLIAADWSPIRLFLNNNKTLTEATAGSGLDGASGFWRSLLIRDIDGDGKPDIFAGNIGLNTPFHITGEQPAELVAKDFDGNGMVEPVFCYYIKGNDGNYVLSSGISRDEWAVQMPSLKKMFDRNALYAKATMDQVLTPDMKTGAITLQANEARSGYFINNGKGGFAFHPLPVTAQTAPVNVMVHTDVTGDGIADIIIAGNEYQTSVGQGRYDASYGCVLQGNGKGDFLPISPARSGFVLDGDVKDLKWVKTGAASLLLAAVNNERMRVFTAKK